MILALRGDELPIDALYRASALTRVLGCDLQVVRILPSAKTRRSSRRDGRNRFRQTVAIARATQKWLGESLGAPFARRNLKLRHGDFRELVAVRAHALAAPYIVVSPETARRSGCATALAREAGKTVIVAREASSSSTIVAATDLSLNHYPVLRKASALSSRCDAPMVALHNVTPVLPLASTPIGAPLVMRSDAAFEEDRRKQLEHAAHDLALDASTLLTNEHDAVRAILAAASHHDADLIAVGTRPRSFLRRIFGERTAERLVHESRRSVMLVPIQSSAT